jgi:hypothetical protein
MRAMISSRETLVGTPSADEASVVVQLEEQVLVLVTTLAPREVADLGDVLPAHRDRLGRVADAVRVDDQMRAALERRSQIDVGAPAHTERGTAEEE